MTKTTNYYGLYENDGYKFEDYKITLIEKTYIRTDSGKSWKKKPIEEKEEVIQYNNYFNYISSVHLFKNLGGYERIEKGYTVAGYVPIKLISISPSKEIKKVREFKIESK